MSAISLFVYFPDLKASNPFVITSLLTQSHGDPCSWLSVGSTQRQMMMMMMLVGEGEKKLEMNRFCTKAFSSSCMGFCGSLHGDHAVGYHHQLNAQIYSKTEMMVLFMKGKKS